MTYSPAWRPEDERRVRILECLFLIDGRTDPAHPHYHTYTGLYQQYRAGAEALSSEAMP